MKSWLLYALISASLWGLWGFFGKLASRTLTSQNLLLLGSLGSLAVFPIYIAFFSKHLKFIWNQADYYTAILGGVVGSVGSLCFYLAISKGEASRVVTITAIYPVVTFFLAFLFLKEPITIQKLIGIGLAVFGVFLLSR